MFIGLIPAASAWYSQKLFFISRNIFISNPRSLQQQEKRGKDRQGKKKTKKAEQYDRQEGEDFQT